MKNVMGVLLVLFFLFSAVSSAGAVISDDFSPPVIDVWYGKNQVFGQIGVPQVTADILGNVIDQSGIASLTYSLNRGPQLPLSMGPNGNRLENYGDFDAELPFADLTCGNNTVIITATDNSGNTARETVNVQYTCGNYWPESYSIDWSTVTNIQNVAQVVDGVWAVENGVLRPMSLGYDRLIAFGDIDPSWDDYEVTVPITFHNLDSMTSHGPFVGILMRWQGHYDWGSQPKHGWWPLGGLGGYGFDWSDNTYKLHILGNNAGKIAEDKSGRLLTEGVPYIFKMRVETAGLNSMYSLKAWEQGSTEPVVWDMSGQGLAGELKYGSVLLVSHYVDVDFGNVIVTPGPFADTTPPVISNIQAAPTVTSATITWTTNEPATSRVQYGPTTAYENGVVESTALTASHSITLTNLTPQTTYHYKVTSADGSNNAANSGNLTFRTRDAQSVIVSDDFNACSLNTSLWTFIDPLGDATLSVTGTQVSISVPGGIPHDVWTTGNFAPRIMQPANNADFEIEAKFDSALSGQYQMSGIIVEQDSSNFLRFDFYSTSENTMIFAVVMNTGKIEKNMSIGGVPSSAPLYMRIKRVGDQWTQSYSFNGATWTQSVAFDHVLSVTAVGTFAGNAGTNPAYTALIDYFFNTASPIVPEDGNQNQLTVHVMGNGAVVKNPDKPAYLCGEKVALTASPAMGWHFSGWSGDLSGTDNSKTLTVSGNHTVTASFAIDTYTITATAGANGTITPSGSVAVECGTNKMFTVKPAAGHRIKDVKVDGTSIGAVSTHTFSNITANHTIAAEFGTATAAAPDLSLDVSSLDFDKVKRGVAVETEITITNTGSADLIVSGLEISGKNSTSFSTTFTHHLTIMPSQSVKIGVIFRPVSLGDKKAVLTIKSNDPDAPARSIPLRGIGSVKDEKLKDKHFKWHHFFHWHLSGKR